MLNLKKLLETKLRIANKGYSQEQVNTILFKTEQHFNGNLILTGRHIDNTKFTVVKNGYDSEQVDELLSIIGHQLTEDWHKKEKTAEELRAVSFDTVTPGYDKYQVQSVLAKLEERAAAQILETIEKLEISLKELNTKEEILEAVQNFKNDLKS